jgi:hypothetical protein
MAGCRGAPPDQRTAGATTPTSSPASPAEAPTGQPVAAASGTNGQGGNGGGVTPAKPDRCRTEHLRVTLRLFEWPGQAGAEQEAELGLTNVGRRPCVLQGYAGLRLVGPDGQPRPTKVIREGNRPVRPITLAPKATGWALVAWMFTPNPDEENTSPLCGGRLGRIRVTPPGNTATLTATTRIGTVCRHGELAIWPFQRTRPSDSWPPQ